MSDYDAGDFFEYGGWNADKAAVYREQFVDFTKHVKINSKERGEMILGDSPYRSQHIFRDRVFGGLAEDKHDFSVLKSRQLGITTETRAFTLFWAGIHKGLRGAMVFDTSDHKEEARLELLTMVRELPSSLGFPQIVRENRGLVQLSNQTVINFASAGVKESKSSGTLGRSSGLNFLHASELCSWNNPAGYEALKNALAENFPDRLFVKESTARGHNIWKEMWDEAVLDTEHQVAIFIGWWAKDNQIIRQNSRDFERYGAQPPSDKEREKIRSVKELYNWEITQEQLAWYRRKIDPTAEAEGDTPAEYEGDGLKLQEQPWTAEEAFQVTGATFFDPAKLTEIANKHTSKNYKTYAFSAGTEFVDMRAYPAPNSRSVQLKIWEEPDPDGVYIVGVDPAFGMNEHNDRSAIQVLRAYADGIDQVAEYAWPLINTRQFAWVVATLLGYYKECYLIVELNGPGEAVWLELQSLKRNLVNSYQTQSAEEKGLTAIFANVKNYMYNRADSMTPGRAYHMVTNSRLKVSMMERLRDFTSNNMLIVRSMETLEEMKAITREGDTIEAAGTTKDDRVMAMAMAIRCWEDRARKVMGPGKRTRENEAAKKRLTIKDQIMLFNNAHLDSFFATKKRLRSRANSQLRKASWRSR